MNILDKAIGWFSPAAGVRRAHARKVLERSFQGAESSRLTNNKRPKNQSADQELLGPFGADSVRAWARALVRDNAYAWNAVDTIVSNVIGSGIDAQSVYETPEGDDIEDVNDYRDSVFAEWCEVCDVNGQLTFAEMQALAMREIVEAGEVLIRIVRTPGKEYRGIRRPVPLALEIIEADRLSLERDTFKSGIARAEGTRIVRGVEVDDLGKPVAYWIYPQHPSTPYSVGNQTPERAAAKDIIHLFRVDRVGQTRGVSWFAPAMQHIRDMGVYLDNELQASAVAACFTAVIKSDSPTGSLLNPEGEDSTDENGNTLEYLEPGLVARLRKDESIEVVNPGRPNSAADPWIQLILRGVAAGIGVSYEALSKDFSKTSYSSSRTSKLEDRPRYKRWQNYMLAHLCQPVWDEFCNAAANASLDNFPTSAELLDERRKVAPVEWQLPEWEWVDPMSEQQSAESSLKMFMSTYQDELGGRGRSWRATYYQAAKEKKLRQSLGLLTPEEVTAQMMAKQTEANATTTGDSAGVNVAATALNGAQVTSLVDVITQVGTGAMPKDTAKPVLQAAFPSFSPELIGSIIDPIRPGSIAADGVPQGVNPDDSATQTSGAYMNLSTQQWNRNSKAINKTLTAFSAGEMTEAAARVFLKTTGLPDDAIETLITDASDGTLDAPLEEVAASE